MFTRTIAVAATAALLALPAAADHMKVRIHNDTGVTLYAFQSTNSGSNKWGSDVMGNTTLPSGRSMVLNFDNQYGYCVFDFRAIFVDGSELTRGGVNVCQISDYYYTP